MHHSTAGMKTKIVSFFILVTLITVGYLHADSNTPSTKVFRLSDRQMIPHEQMVDDLRKADIVFVGEMHDREAHHQLQLDIIKALRTPKTPVAVGFEMFTYESQKDLDNWVAGTMPDSDFIKTYYRNWNFPWPL